MVRNKITNECVPKPVKPNKSVKQPDYIRIT